MALDAGPDRKSTRLNSSHTVISYAVFCLKKKSGDHLHSGTVVGKLEGEKGITMGFVDLMREDHIELDRERGIYFTQDWASMLFVFHDASTTEIYTLSLHDALPI